MIRHCQLSDAEEIHKLIEPYISDFTTGSVGAEKFSLESIKSIMSQSDVEYLVKVEKHKILGVIAYRSSHLIHFFVDRNYLGLGLGKLLWTHYLDKLRFKNIKSVTVNSSIRAIPIYKKIGFQQLSAELEFEGIKFVKMQNEIE